MIHGHTFLRTVVTFLFFIVDDHLTTSYPCELPYKCVCDAIKETYANK